MINLELSNCIAKVSEEWLEDLRSLIERKLLRRKNSVIKIDLIIESDKRDRAVVVATAKNDTSDSTSKLITVIRLWWGRVEIDTMILISEEDTRFLEKKVIDVMYDECVFEKVLEKLNKCI